MRKQKTRGIKESPYPKEGRGGLLQSQSLERGCVIDEILREVGLPRVGFPVAGAAEEGGVAGAGERVGLLKQATRVLHEFAAPRGLQGRRK